MHQSRKILNIVIQDFTEDQKNELHLLVIHGYTHLGCKGTISKKNYMVWLSAYHLHVIYHLHVSLSSVYPYVHLSLSIYHLPIYLSTTFPIYLSILHLHLPIYRCLSFSIYLPTFMCLCIYFHVYNLSFKTSSIHPFIIDHPSINALKTITYLSTYLCIQ